MTTATGYMLGTPGCEFPHLGTFPTADAAHDHAEVLNRRTGRNYFLHVILSDGSIRPVKVAA
jgi:hypothetical protein